MAGPLAKHCSANRKLKNDTYLLMMPASTLGKIWPHLHSYEAHIHFLHVISVRAGLNKSGSVSRRLSAQCEVFILSNGVGEPQSLSSIKTQLQPAMRFGSFCTGLVPSKVIKQGLCPLLQLGLHTVSRLFILAQSQGNNVVPLYMFDRWRPVLGEAPSGRFVISFLFTSKELFRVLKIEPA